MPDEEHKGHHDLAMQTMNQIQDVGIGSDCVTLLKSVFDGVAKDALAAKGWSGEDVYIWKVVFDSPLEDGPKTILIATRNHALTEVSAQLMRILLDKYRVNERTIHSAEFLGLVAPLKVKPDA